MGSRSFSRRRRAFSTVGSAFECGTTACVFERRGDPAPKTWFVSRQARSIDGRSRSEAQSSETRWSDRRRAIPSSPAIWFNGRPLLASNPTASHLNSSVKRRRVVPIKHLLLLQELGRGIHQRVNLRLQRRVDPAPRLLRHHWLRLSSRAAVLQLSPWSQKRGPSQKSAKNATWRTNLYSSETCPDTNSSSADFKTAHA